MAKKSEPGISYYRMNSGHTMNKKIRLLYSEHGTDGYWIWACLLDESYKNYGYYFDVADKDHLELFSSDHCKKPIELVIGVIKTCLRRGLFDKEIYDTNKVLTCEMMQEIYLHATKEIRRKGTEVELVKEFLLLPKSDIENEPCLSIVSWKISPKSGKPPGKKQHSIVYDTIGKDVPASPAPGEKWNDWVDSWFVFYKLKNENAEPNFNGVQGKALKGIKTHLGKISILKEGQKKEVAAFVSWQYILAHWNKQDDWLQTQFDLTVLLKKINDIVNRIKNGNKHEKTRQNYSHKPTITGEATGAGAL